MPAMKQVFQAKMAYTLSTTTSTRPSSCRMGSSSCCPKYFELSDDSKIVIARPTAIAEMKKNTGSSGLYQNGCSLSGMIRYTVPSEDWCKVERITPQNDQRDQYGLDDLQRLVPIRSAPARSARTPATARSCRA